MFDKFLGKAFTEVLWPLWTKSLVKAGAPKVWSKCFRDAASHVVIDPMFANNLASLPALQRLLINTFKPDRLVPTATDFAISIAFELQQQDFECTFGKSLSTTEIRHWAASIRQMWLEAIVESPVMRARYKEVRDKHPSTVMSEDAACMPEIDRTLGVREELLKAYFGRFSVPNATEVVYVWLPDSDHEVHWDQDRRIVVPVSLNTSQGADRGFFRTGHDYSLSDVAPVEWLQVCYLDEKRLMEAGKFGGRSVGKQTDHILWLR